MNPNPRTPSPGSMAITSVAESLQSHRSGTGTAFVQANRKAAGRKEFHSLIKPTTELSKRGMNRFIEKLQQIEIREREEESHDGLANLFARPLAMLSPIFVAIAGKHSRFSNTVLYCPPLD